MAKILTLSILVLGLIGFVTPYKVLVAMLTPSKSHYNHAKAVCDILHQKGHEVTFVSGYKFAKQPYREVFIPEIDNAEDFPPDFENSKQSYWNKFLFMDLTSDFVKLTMDQAMQSETLQKFLNDKKEKFDLVVMDYAMTETFFALSVKYDCPLILLSPAPMIHWLTRLTGNPVSPATVPSFFFDFTDQMTFYERFLNSLLTFVQDVYTYLFYDDIQNHFYTKYFPEEAAKVKFSDLKRRVSLVFANTFPAISYARPYLPNTIEVGGYHVDPKPLPKEYQDIMDNAKNGVIFFSMGSFFKTSTMPKYMIDIILKSFSKLNETVLWKFEAELEGRPKNVIIKKWMPQTDILAHPNIKLFVSHGGMASSVETTYNGVPVLSIPVAYDQYHNARMIDHAKTGIIMTLDTLSEKKFDKALHEVLHNKIYTENAKKMQKLYLDRPMSPRELVAFYVEHVIRTGGAKHLSGPQLNIASYCLVDVIAAIAIPPILLIVTMFYICKMMCCGNKTRSDSKGEKMKRH